MWWKSAVNLSFFLSFATFRMRSSACDTLTRLCARHVLCWSAATNRPLLRALEGLDRIRRSGRWKKVQDADSTSIQNDSGPSGSQR
jgi:hypothetical protein